MVRPGDVLQSCNSNSTCSIQLETEMPALSRANFSEPGDFSRGFGDYLQVWEFKGSTKREMV